MSVSQYSIETIPAVQERVTNNTILLQDLTDLRDGCGGRHSLDLGYGRNSHVFLKNMSWTEVNQVVLVLLTVKSDGVSGGARRNNGKFRGGAVCRMTSNFRIR